MKLIFGSEDGKYDVDTEKLKKMTQNAVPFLGNLISIGNSKLSLLLRDNSKLTVNVLRSSPKISDLIKNSFC